MHGLSHFVQGGQGYHVNRRRCLQKGTLHVSYGLPVHDVREHAMKEAVEKSTRLSSERRLRLQQIILFLLSMIICL